jgi:hypothetical protein
MVLILNFYENFRANVLKQEDYFMYVYYIECISR